MGWMHEGVSGNEKSWGAVLVDDGMRNAWLQTWKRPKLAFEEEEEGEWNSFSGLGFHSPGFRMKEMDDGFGRSESGLLWGSVPWM